MNWITGKIKKLVSSVKSKLQKPSIFKSSKDSLWRSCPECKKMHLKTDLKQNYFICSCNYHFSITPKEWFDNLIFDEGEYTILPCPDVYPDPINFTVNDIKYIDKYNGYKKKTGQESAILIANGKMNGSNIVCAAYNFDFGGAAITIREAEYLISAMEFAKNNQIDCFLQIYTSGGMSVYGNLFSLSKGMTAVISAMQDLKKQNIVTCGILQSKVTGGTYVDVFANDFLFAIKNSTDLLFSGKRVSKNAGVSESEMPDDFGTGSGLERNGLIDGVVENRLEIRNKVSALIKVLLKKYSDTSVEHDLDATKDTVVLSRSSG